MKIKKAFTIAEVLLCIGIIGIVSAMGLVVTKSTTDRAYSYYFYNGYVNLYNALLESESRLTNPTNQELLESVADMFDTEIKTASLDVLGLDKDIPFLSYYALNDLHIDTPPIKADWADNPVYSEDKYFPVDDECTGGGGKLPDTGGNINSGITVNPNDKVELPEEFIPPKDETKNPPVLDTTIEPVKGGDRYIQAANGIKYYYNSAGLNDKASICLTMTVPQKKTRDNNGEASIVLVFTSINNIKYLIPVDALSDVKLQERRDLLPVYIDDGVVGRARADGKVTQKSFYSYKDVYCRLTAKSIDKVISCEQAAPVSSGVLKVSDPRKS